MSAIPESCPICQKDVIADDIIVKIGAEGINNASIARGDKTIVTAGTVVHKSCRMTYVNKKDIEKHKKARLDIPTLSVKRIGRLSTGTCDNKADCRFLANALACCI